jgi:GDPmannose 4,6-dehydratase
MYKISLITGITGQDGAYLARLLLEKGHRVTGIVRHGQEKIPVFGLDYLSIMDKVQILPCDLCSSYEVGELLANVQPDEIYNLAGQSSVSQSYKIPNKTLNYNILSVLTLLEEIRCNVQNIKFYHASSSEMFGIIKQLPIVEDMSFHPVSPYAVSKASAHWIAKNYRESYGLFISCGILFNHESYLRSRNFFIKYLICEALEISLGNKDKLILGNLNLRRDFGFAPSYVEAMYLMLQHKKPDDFLVCSGSSILLQEIADYVCDKIGIDRSCLVQSKELFRPLDIPDIYGDNSKVKNELVL